MRFGFPLTDYKIQSIEVFRGAVFSLCLIVLGALTAELFFDLRSTTLPILIPACAICLSLALLALWFPRSQFLRFTLTTVVYLIIEAHFVINPTIFHAIIYWFPFVALLSLVIQGIRAAQLWVVILLATVIMDGIYVGQTVGESYIIEVYRLPFLAIGLLFTLSIFSVALLLYVLLGDAYSKVKQQTIKLDEAKGTLEEKKNLLEKYQQELINVSRTGDIFDKGRQHVFRAVCKSAASTLDVSRVSIWLLDEACTRIERQFLYEVSSESDEIVILEQKDFPTYFKAILQKPFIIASHAREDEETREFTSSYLKPLDIYSMLDCPIILDKTVVGVICCENQKRVKQWNVEDALFVQSLADFVALGFKNQRINELLGELRSKNIQLVGKNNEIETMNVELIRLNEKLKTMNENLENTVQRRTKEVETRNTQLTEYAFINSHLLRAPLTRILGLSDLIAREVKTPNDKELLLALIQSSQEMDSIIRRISDILYDSNSPTREDVKAIIARNLGVSNITTGSDFESDE